MRRARARGRRTLVAGAAACLLGAALLVAQAERPVRARAGPPAPPTAADAHPSAAPMAPPAPARARELAPATGASSVDSRTELARLERVRRELAQVLRSEPFDRPSFERAVAALASRLTEPELEALRLEAEASGEESERLARLELLAARARGTYRLAPAERAELLMLLECGSSAAGESAARLLATLGEARDRARLVEALAASAEAVRARGLRALLRLPLDEELRAELAVSLELAPTTPELDSLRARLAPPRGPGRPPLETLRTDSLPGEERLAAAEELVRALPVPEATAYLVEALMDAAPATRRRALYALAPARDPAVAARLAEVARFDPDPATRGAAVRVLSPESERALLEELARCDSAPEVRALAAQRSSVPHD